MSSDKLGGGGQGSGHARAVAGSRAEPWETRVRRTGTRGHTEVDNDTFLTCIRVPRGGHGGRWGGT